MRGTTELFLIDGQPIVVPDSNLKLQLQDLESSDSGRDESAVMHRYLVRQGVGKWRFSYTELIAEEYAYMETLFAGKAEFLFTRPDTRTGQAVTTKCYRSDHRILWDNGATGQFRNYQFEIAEC